MKILSITIKHENDNTLSTSDSIGRYSMKPGNEWAVNRKACGDVDDNRSAHYWTPFTDRLDGQTEDDKRKIVAEDYARCEAFNKGEWSYVGVFVEAVIQLGVNEDLCQTIQSGGLWGIASDESRSYFADIACDELNVLKDELGAIGFTAEDWTTAISTMKGHK